MNISAAQDWPAAGRQNITRPQLGVRGLLVVATLATSSTPLPSYASTASSQRSYLRKPLRILRTQLLWDIACQAEATVDPRYAADSSKVDSARGAIEFMQIVRDLQLPYIVERQVIEQARESVRNFGGRLMAFRAPSGARGVILAAEAKEHGRFMNAHDYVAYEARYQDTATTYREVRPVPVPNGKGALEAVWNADNENILEIRFHQEANTHFLRPVALESPSIQITDPEHDPDDLLENAVKQLSRVFAAAGSVNVQDLEKAISTAMSEASL